MQPTLRRPKATLQMEDIRVDIVYPAHVRGRIAELFQLVPHDGDLAGVEALFSGWGGPVLDASFLSRAPDLKVCFYAAGTVRRVMTDAFWERGGVITSAYAANAVAVSEFAFAQTLNLLKGTWPAIHFMKRTRGGRSVTGFGCHRSTVGLVSYGATARMLRQHLRTIGAEVIAFDPYVSADDAAREEVQLVSLNELFARSNVVSIHTPALPETAGMIRGDHLNLMRPGAGFLNTARGSVVDHDELLTFLKQRPDVTAVLDVTDPEPPPPESEFYDLSNVVLTPHIAGSNGSECARLGEAMVGEAERWLTGEALRWRITPEVATRMA